MIDFKKFEIWFVTGSQHLYGQEILQKVKEHSAQMVEGINREGQMPVKLVHHNVLTGSEEILQLLRKANHDPACIGIVSWMHTFSPAKMWINGLKALQKPMLHLHTQFNRDIPWDQIDMDFMNLNQSAHGGREFGFMVSRLRKKRKVLVGHWQDEEVLAQLARWSRVAMAWHDWQGARFARIGDNMREVAVTEGDKVEAQIKFGYSVNGYGVGDVAAMVKEVKADDVKELLAHYEASYTLGQSVEVGGKDRHHLEEAARIELGIRSFLEQGNFKGYTDTFEDLHGLRQLPGIATQRLMEDGYGFGAEGDWKTAALLRAAKVMSHGLAGGTSFMEDYTYHFHPNAMRVLGSHMLEICPSIADAKPRCEVHPLSIGGKEDPARLIFNTAPGDAINVSMMDMGGRFRLLLNEVKAVAPEHDLPKLPVARVLWEPQPSLKEAATAWILAGGAHHTVFSKALSSDFMEDFAEMADIEFLVIDKDTKIRDFKNHLNWNEVYFQHL